MATMYTIIIYTIKTYSETIRNVLNFAAISVDVMQFWWHFPIAYAYVSFFMRGKFESFQKQHATSISSDQIKNGLDFNGF